ncbi:MAG: response regulator [Proteobacteria bacterium]|nr:response regulator [Pseudomonadota bacterium]
MSNQTDHILIVDDDRDIRQLLAEYLEKQGLRCTTAADGRDMKAKLETHRVDLIVLDIMMPGEDGLSLCRNLRASGSPQANTPILMLTARGEDMDRILGLEMGADDYLPKPFVPRELYARIRAILRRTRALPPNLEASPPANARELHFAHWRLDTVNRHLIDGSGTVVALSGAEYRLLGVFLAHPQKVLSRDQLMELTQGREADVFDRSIDLLVSRLRQRLGDNAREPAIIKTVRNEGYVLAAEVITVGDERGSA